MRKKKLMKTIIMKSNRSINQRKKLQAIIMRNSKLHKQQKKHQHIAFLQFKTLIQLLLVKTSSKHVTKTHLFLSSFNHKLIHKEFLMSGLQMGAWKMFKSESQEQAIKDHKKHFDFVFIENIVGLIWEKLGSKHIMKNQYSFYF